MRMKDTETLRKLMLKAYRKAWFEIWPDAEIIVEADKYTLLRRGQQYLIGWVTERTSDTLFITCLSCLDMGSTGYERCRQKGINQYEDLVWDRSGREWVSPGGRPRWFSRTGEFIPDMMRTIKTSDMNQWDADFADLFNRTITALMIEGR